MRTAAQFDTQYQNYATRRPACNTTPNAMNEPERCDKALQSTYEKQHFQRSAGTVTAPNVTPWVARNRPTFCNQESWQGDGAMKARGQRMPPEECQNEEKREKGSLPGNRCKIWSNSTRSLCFESHNSLHLMLQEAKCCHCSGRSQAIQTAMANGAERADNSPRTRH